MVFDIQVKEYNSARQKDAYQEGKPVNRVQEPDTADYKYQSNDVKIV